VIGEGRDAREQIGGQVRVTADPLRDQRAIDLDVVPASQDTKASTLSRPR